MGKRVVIVASGETERRCLPHLCAHLRQHGVAIIEVRIPNRHKALDVDMAARLIHAAWFERDESEKPDKFVVLIDADGRDGEALLRPFHDELRQRTAPVAANLQLAYAQWHLEAWFFADSVALRNYLGRDLGSVDPSRPDEVHNPKGHLKHLLTPHAYTAVISEEIAQRLSAQTVSDRSPSFRQFVIAVCNGESTNARQ